MGRFTFARPLPVTGEPTPFGFLKAAAEEGARRLTDLTRGLGGSGWPHAPASSVAAPEAAAYPPDGDFIEIENVRLHWLERGSGRPVVFIHGAGSMLSEVLASPMAALVSSQYRLILVDRPGYGHSTRPGPAMAGPTAQARLLKQMLGALGIARPILIGHSWGGAMALAYALDFPADTAGLLILAGWSHPARAGTLWLAGLPSAPLIGGLLTHALPLAGGLAHGIVEQIFAPEPVPASFDHFALPLALRPSQLRANAEDLAVLNAEVTARAPFYPRIDCPVEILTGAADQIVDPVAHAQRLARDIPNARLEILPGGGHMLHHTRPQAVAGALDRLAARVSAAG